MKTPYKSIDNLVLQTVNFGNMITRYMYSRRATEDEHADALIGLNHTLRRFNDQRGSWSTFLWVCIRGAILEGKRRDGHFPKRRVSELSMRSIDADADRACRRARRKIPGWAYPDVTPAWAIDYTRPEDAMVSREKYKDLLSCLSGQDLYVIRSHYLDGEEFKNIARLMGVTRQRVCFIHRRAIRRIKKHVSERKEA